MVTNAEASPDEAVPVRTFFLNVSEIRKTRYGWKPRKCERCRQVPGECIVRFWLDSELGEGQYLVSCRQCLTRPEIEAWRCGAIYRIDAPEQPPTRTRLQRGKRAGA